MLTIFNREELLLTREQNVFFSAQQKLSKAGITYRTKARDLNYRRRGGHMGTLGLRADAVCEYSIYVHRRDLELAQHILQTD